VSLPPTSPDMKGRYAFDENGDHTLDNALANLLRALTVAGFTSMQSDENTALTLDGDALALLSIATRDPALLSDGAARTSLMVGRTQKFPDLSGAGSFTVDNSAPIGRDPGSLQGGGFVGVDPARQNTDIVGALRFGFLGTIRFTVPLHGLHIELVATPSGVMSGQIDGVVTVADVQKLVAQNIADNMNVLSAMSPCPPGSDCANARKLDLDGNGKIDVLDVMQGPLGLSLLPDVQMFDAMGRYQPTYANNQPNAWSVGVGITAAKATFTEP
jgi:hypothetical protein